MKAVAEKTMSLDGVVAPARRRFLGLLACLVAAAHWLPTPWPRPWLRSLSRREADFYRRIKSGD